MKYKVFLISDAEEDLFEIYKYVALKDSTNKAQTLIQKLKDTCFSLAELPKRGHIPPELERIGVYDFFEIHYKPFRIIYQIIETKVYIHCVTKFGGDAVIYGVLGATYPAFQLVGAPILGKWSDMYGRRKVKHLNFPLNVTDILQ